MTSSFFSYVGNTTELVWNICYACFVKQGGFPMNNGIKNMNHETVVRLADQIDILPGQVVSKTLAQNGSVSVTLFGFDQGEEISTHESGGDAMVSVLYGKGRFTIDGKVFELSKCESIVMPANKPHSVFAKEAFKMLLIVVFPQNK